MHRPRIPGSCYGSFGVIDRPIPAGSFALAGTFTQLMGVFPGFISNPVEDTGSVARAAMTLNMSVPALSLTLGPFRLTAGAGPSWPASLYS